MKACTIWSSDRLTDCIWAIRSLAGLEKWHSSMLQVATESLQPHWQAIRAPTRRTSTLGFSEAVWATAAAASTTISRTRTSARPLPDGRGSVPLLLFNRRMLCRIAHHFRAGVLHFDLARHQAD